MLLYSLPQSAPTLVLTWVCQQMQACWAMLVLLPGHAGAYSQQGCWSLLARRAFQTALLHLKPPPKPSCQTRSPRLTPLVCSMLDRMYLRTSNTILQPSHAVTTDTAQVY